METRSSPSLLQLKRLAQQAHIEAGDISSLSKPALFGHLRSNYDYQRLERAHQMAVKRDGGREKGGNTITGDTSKNGSNSGDDSRHDSRKKRKCRAAGRDAGNSHGGGSSSSPASPLTSVEDQGLPPASIFVQTRSRSRMLLLAAGNNGAGTDAGQQPPAPEARASNTTPRQRTKLKLGGGRGKRGGGGSGGGGSSSGGAKAEAECGCGSNGGRAEETASAAAADSSAAADSAAAAAAAAPAGAEGKSEGDCEATESSENTAKRKGQPQQQQQQPRRNDKGKGKAKDSTIGGDGGKGRSDDTSAPPGHAQGGVGAGKERSKKALNLPNELDPIMLVKVGKDHYRFVRPNGRVVLYNLDSLVDYFISTGDFLEPETRLPFSDDELRAIDFKAKAAGLSKPSVLEAKRDPSRYAEQKFQQDALVGLERMTSELVTGMLRIVEECDREEGEIRLVTEIFPPFADLFKQIWAADKSFALQCMQHYTSWLEGPPNRPTEDEMGFLDIILGFLKQLQECGGSSPFGF